MARRVLESALDRTGGQDAAHTVRDHARQTLRPPAPTLPEAWRPTPQRPSEAHRRTLQALQNAERRHGELARTAHLLRRQHTDVSAQLAAVPRLWGRRRRSELTIRLGQIQTRLDHITENLDKADRHLDELRTEAADHAARQASRPAALPATPPLPPAAPYAGPIIRRRRPPDSVDRRPAYLSQPEPTRSAGHGIER
jgi:hypothetical protein